MRVKESRRHPASPDWRTSGVREKNAVLGTGAFCPFARTPLMRFASVHLVTKQRGCFTDLNSNGPRLIGRSSGLGIRVALLQLP